MLDKSKPFGKIFGVTKNNARFVQEGVSYDGEGEFADDKEKKKYMKMLQDKSKEAAAHAAELAQAAADLAQEAQDSLKKAEGK